jgi:hypothetical protein
MYYVVGKTNEIYSSEIERSVIAVSVMCSVLVTEINGILVNAIYQPM